MDGVGPGKFGGAFRPHMVREDFDIQAIKRQLVGKAGHQNLNAADVRGKALGGDSNQRRRIPSCPTATRRPLHEWGCIVDFARRGEFRPGGLLLDIPAICDMEPLMPEAACPGLNPGRSGRIPEDQMLRALEFAPDKTGAAHRGRFDAA